MKKLLLYSFLALIASSCAIQAPQPTSEAMGGIAASAGNLCDPLAPCHDGTLIFAAIEDENSPLSTGKATPTNLFVPHLTSSHDYYLLNLPPGLYALVGYSTAETKYAGLGPLGTGVQHTYRSYLGLEDIKRGIIEVKPGRISYLGKLKLSSEGVNNSIVMESEDPAVQHYFRQEYPENATGASNLHVRLGHLDELDQGEASQAEFLERARQDLAKSGWTP